MYASNAQLLLFLFRGFSHIIEAHYMFGHDFCLCYGIGWLISLLRLPPFYTRRFMYTASQKHPSSLFVITLANVDYIQYFFHRYILNEQQKNLEYRIYHIAWNMLHYLRYLNAQLLIRVAVVFQHVQFLNLQHVIESTKPTTWSLIHKLIQLLRLRFPIWIIIFEIKVKITFTRQNCF